MLKIICPNTAIDFRIVVSGFEVGSVLRAITSDRFASGKGVNSAFTADFLGFRAILSAVVGAVDADIFRSKEFSTVDCELLCVDGETRRNLTIVDRDKLVSHIQTAGYAMRSEQVEEFCTNALNGLGEQDTALISGSLPNGFSNKRYHKFIRDLGKTGSKLLVDTDLDRLVGGSKFSIDFVKPNLAELSAFAKLTGRTSAQDVIQEIFQLGVRRVIVSCGSAGVLLFQEQNKSFHAKTTFGGEGKEAIGSGDAFMGAFSAYLSDHKTLENALAGGVSAGHSNVFHHGPGRIGSSFFEILATVEAEEVMPRDAYRTLEKMLLSL